MICIHNTTGYDCKLCLKRLGVDLIYKKIPCNRRPKGMSLEEWETKRSLLWDINNKSV